MYSDCHLFYSIYTSRPVYSFLYTIINGNVIASFVPKKKRFETLRCKKNFFVYVRNLEPSPPPPTPPPTPLVRNCTHLAWSLHSFFVSTYYVDDPLISPRMGGGGLIIFQGFKLRRLLESSTEKKDALISESEELFTVTFKT